ncbi:MAG: tRNA (guanosine(46)-N7)-methyltransferase TrmB [Bacteroidia bacterium]|nr:tRNA (guanosine(46)-N7)-methyltransferase TrmB [Bacteroidia bacterium]
MSKNKTEKFLEFDAFENTLDFNSDTKGKWATIFGNSNPIVLELACGKGDYAIGMARMYQNKNFVGVDIKGNRLWRGAKTATDEKLEHVRFLRIQIDFIEKHFAPGEVSEIWITFPDPQPAKYRKRLTSTKFLNLYRNIAAKNAIVNLKTDSDLFYESTLETIAEEQLEILENINNVYAQPSVSDLMKIKTFYENIWLKEGRTIKFIQFNLNK